ncbi:LysR family transcriptional regulator [Bordetella genomosp. 10]|uniref:LysR family transcriptional regulator n=1 Tax=Bordetella genomosp. 10 TaxID=1416804 RepID=A0A261SCF6_9BORD|nr:LysR family transcriptional regulator [Bordetella genomosp. 10]OZI34490.1 LysR family transcriptional regulator [Bordetella genomosp. 10]
MPDTADAPREDGLDDDDSADAAGSGTRPPLNLRQIEVFRAIMLTGSISGAGRMLHVSQPAISRVLALTESRLRFPLFERSRSRLAPTAEARRLFAEVEQVYGGIQRVNELAANLAQAGAGALRVISSASFGQRMVPQALAVLRQGRGQARVDYRSSTYDELAGHFLSGQADIAVSMRPPVHPNLVSVELGRSEVVCVMPSDHPLARCQAVAPADFAAGAWIGYPADAPLGRVLTAYLGYAPNRTPAAIEVHSPVTALAFVQQGLGPALVDSWCVGPRTRAGLAVRPIVPPAHIGIWATYSELQPLPLMARRFLAALKKVLQDEPGPSFEDED